MKSKCVAEGGNKLCERTGSVLQFHGRVMVESSPVVKKMTLHANSVEIVVYFFAASTTFGDVVVLLSWPAGQVQNLVKL